MTTFIYALIDPRTSECRYIGKTDRVSQRLGQHIKDTNRAVTHKINWIKNLASQKLRPEVIVLEEISMSAWQEAEIFWIAYMQALGSNLTNGNMGGVGGIRPTAATRSKISAASKGRVLSQEHRNKIGEASRRRTQSPSARAKISEAAKKRVGELNPHFGRKNSEETKSRMSEIAKQRVLSPARKAQLAAILAEVRSRPEVRAKQAQYKANLPQDVRDKIAAAGKGRVKSVEERAKLSAALKGRVRTPEHCKAISESKKGKKLSTETRLKMSLARKGRALSEEHKANNGKSQSARWDRYYADKGIDMPKKSLARRLRREAQKNKESTTCDPTQYSEPT